jgi:hypothetical protein
MTEAGQHSIPAAKRRSGRFKLLAVLLVCAAPVIASYLTYYVIQPEGRTNYGELVQPQREVSALAGTLIAGDAKSLADLRGKWIMLTVSEAACDKACQDRLYAIRQVRLTTGKERERVERLLIIIDSGRPDPALLQSHDGMHVIAADQAQVARLFPPAQQGQVADHIFIVDPLGNLMMRFPKDADPNRMKKDLSKLLRASRVG